MTTKAQTNCMRIVDELIGFGAVKGSEVNLAVLEKAIRKCVGVDERTVKIYVQVMQDFDFLKISANGWTLEKLVI